MKKLYTLLGQRLCKGDVGVEIECEGENLQMMDTGTWRTERDGSLRGSYPTQAAEYVMCGPVAITKLEAALDEIIGIQQAGGAQFNFSFRTSVHVHVNVQDLTEDEMLAFLYLCLLLEEPLMNFCGETRKGNRFCLRYADAEGYDRTLDQIFERGARYVPLLDGNRIRYAAINIHSLKKYGSIEFRGMRGNMDKETLTAWAETLISLREYAKALGSPAAVYNNYIQTQNSVFIPEALGKHHAVFEYAGAGADIDRSFSLTIDLPHIHKARPPYVEPVIEESLVPAGLFERANLMVAPAPVMKMVKPPPAYAQILFLAKVDLLYTDWARRNEEMDYSEAFKVTKYVYFYQRACMRGAREGWAFLVE